MVKGEGGGSTQHSTGIRTRTRIMRGMDWKYFFVLQNGDSLLNCDVTVERLVLVIIVWK